MPRKRFVTVAVEDIHMVKVGSLAAFQHRRKMANEPAYREEQRAEGRKPTSLRSMFGMPEALSMRVALGLG